MARFANPRLLLGLALALIATVAISALATARGGESPAPDDGRFAIGLADGALELESGTLSAGRRVIEVTNRGDHEHELVIVKTRKPADELPLGLHGVSVSLAGELVAGEDHAALGHDHGSKVLGQLPGEVQTIQVTLAPGRYVAFCQTANHYLEGERASFTVE